MATLHKLFMVCWLALTAGLTVGCLENDDSWRDRDHDRWRDHDRYGRRGEIPRDAKEVEDGHGTLDHTAKRDGIVYIYDADARVLLFDARVRDNDRVVLRPRDNVITINGREVARMNLGNNHRFKMYFEPSGNRY